MIRSVGAALLALTAMCVAAPASHADEDGYVTCIDYRMQQQGLDTPANPGSWVDLGRKVNLNVHQNGDSPQSQVSMVENLGWDHITAGAIVQCALSQNPF